MANPTLILGANNWAIEEDNILGYALGSSSNQYLPREISFTRGSDATYTDSTGVIRQACWNLLQYSEEFTNGVWNTTGATIAANSITAPNGSLTADTITQTGGTLNVSQAFTIASPGNYTYSTYLKKGNFDSSSLFRFGVYQGVDIGYITYNFATNTTSVISGTFISHSSTSIGDGWYRIQYTINITSTGTAIFYNGGVGGSIGTSNFFYSWGAQLVQGSEPLAYLRTTDRLNIPRVDSSTGSKAFLLEPQRTNLSLWSEDFSQSTWAKSNTTVTTNTTTSPDGVTNADKLIASATTSTHLLIQNPAGSVNGTTVTVSIFAKASELSRIQFVNNAGGVGSAEYNLSAGTVNFASGVSASIVNSGNGWYRCILSYTPTTTGSFNIQIRLLDNSGNTTFTGNGTDGIFIYGAQLELGSYPTTYIPTQASTVTRLADNATATGVGSLIGQSEGTIFWDINDVTGTPTSTGNPDFGIRNTAFTNWIGVTTNGFASPFRIVVRTTSSGIIEYIASVTRAKAAVGWSSSGAVLYVNGSQVGTSAVNPNFSFDRVDILGGIISYKVNQFSLYTSRLSNAELSTLTTL